MADSAIKKHWIVCGFTPNAESLGAVAGVQGAPLATELEAKTRARELAAASPFHYYVVYEANWYAFTDITPVSLLRVTGAAL
jgi:hypothetical protein